MNELALIQHTSYTLHTYVYRFDRDWTRTESFCARTDLLEVIPPLKILSPVLFDTYESFRSDIPRIFLVNGHAVYTVIHVPDGYFLVGPTRFDFNESLVHKLHVKGFPDSFQATLANHEFSFYAKAILLLHNLYHKEILTNETIIRINLPDLRDSVQRKLHRHIFDSVEEGTSHNPYEQEIREQTSIERGDLENLRASIAEDYTGTLGVLADNPLRNAKNMGIVVITLASRSAIRGGMLPELSFSLSDSYIQQLETLTDIPSIQRLIRSAEFHYAEMVQEIIQKEKGSSHRKSPYIAQCQNYIFSHLHDKITIHDLADELGINPNYLSGLFRDQMGVSLSEYILEEKVNRAKNLLTYSQYSYIEIATYLGFSSQSHFSDRFKKVTGYTPKAYRDEFGIRNF